jgi:hypothetical protein
MLTLRCFLKGLLCVSALAVGVLCDWVTILLSQMRLWVGCQLQSSGRLHRLPVGSDALMHSFQHGCASCAEGCMCYYKVS